MSAFLHRLRAIARHLVARRALERDTDTNESGPAGGPR